MSEQADRKRVLFVDHTAKMGGGEIALLNLVQNLDRSRFEPVVVLFSEGPLRERLEQAGTEVHVVPLSGRVLQTRKDSLGVQSLLRFGEAAATFTHVFRLARFIAKQRIDIVHTNSLKADVIGGLAARLARKPLIWHIRDRIDADYLPGPVVRVFRWLCRIIPHRVIANSAATLQTLQLSREKRSEAIYSGINLVSSMRVVHDGLRHSDAGRASGESPDRRIGLVGRISPWKGQHIFLKAAAIVHQRFPEVRFQIIGGALFQEQQYEQELRRLRHSLGLDDVVEFTGFREDVPDLIDALEVLVHASTSGEPFGQVVIEGMAAGKPVVATNGGGVPEIVVDGVTGLLVPMGEVEPMAKAICHLLEHRDLARAMGGRGRERVLESFTITHTAEKVERLYRELLRDLQTPGPEAPGEPATRTGLRRFTKGAVGQSLATVFSILLATLLTLQMRVVFGEHAPVSAPYLAVVAICAAAFGRAVGFFATVVSAVTIAYLVFPPQHSFAIQRADQPAFWVFVFASLLLSQVIGMLKASQRMEELARRRAEEARDDLNFLAKCGAAFSVPTCTRELLATIAYLATSGLCDECNVELATAASGALTSRPSPLARAGRSDGHTLTLSLATRGEAIGTLVLTRRPEGNDFESRDIKLAQEFALRAAMALASIRATSQRADSAPAAPETIAQLA